jgi:hypothetical protein
MQHAQQPERVLAPTQDAEAAHEVEALLEPVERERAIRRYSTAEPSNR